MESTRSSQQKRARQNKRVGVFFVLILMTLVGFGAWLMYVDPVPPVETVEKEIPLNG